MGYWTSLHLIDVKIKRTSLPVVRRALATQKGRGLAPLKSFLEYAVIDRAGFLAFRASKDGSDAYMPYEDGTVPALHGKWRESGRIARWLKQHSQAGGSMVLHSLEADGAAWGWEFDGRGRMRALALCPIGVWE